MLAARYPFRRVLGVELWEDLHRIALANLASYPSGDCGKIESIQMDAADFVLPEEPLVLYFFNPFPAEVLARVLANLKGSLSRAPRRVYVLFYAPVRRGTPWDRRRAIESAGFLQVLCDERRYTIYTAT
jgi:hypothetical protein